MKICVSRTIGTYPSRISETDLPSIHPHQCSQRSKPFAGEALFGLENPGQDKSQALQFAYRKLDVQVDDFCEDGCAWRLGIDATTLTT